MRKVYTKPPLTFEQQLKMLTSRGLIIQDRDVAFKHVSNISYYRLSAYWYPFRVRNSLGEVTDQIEANTSLEEVIQLYEFDRQLRLLVMDAIERIEVALRIQMAHHLAHTYGAFAHTNFKYFHSNFEHDNWLHKIELETSRSSDEFIRHYQNQYDGFPTVPIWMLTEVMSLGGLSILYRGLQHNDKKLVAKHFNVHHKRLADWLHTFTYIRNVCAHHSRLWNRELAIRPDQNRQAEWLPPFTPRNDRIFYILLMLRYLLRAVIEGDDWSCACNKLLEPIVKKESFRIAMGVPSHWQEHPLWK